MSFKKSVLIFGRSLNLAGIGACLKHVEGLDVLEIDPQDPGSKQMLEEFTPEAIIFDLSEPQKDLDLKLLHNKPGALLIGVDPSSDEVLILLGQRNKVLTADELTQLIVNHTEENSTASGC